LCNELRRIIFSKPFRPNFSFNAFLVGMDPHTFIAITQGRTKYISYFEVMPDSVFGKYQALGVKNREDLIISKAARDAKPLKCNGEWFAEHYESDPNNFVYLNAHPKPVYDL